MPVLLTAVNSTTPNTPITKSNNIATFDANLNKGASFNAVLQAGAVPGLSLQPVYAVTYK
ncbi:hypothetical protein [Yokenella regensburgei]|uniref:hypothetical protein n=1 Tax=Yokenella regensburgei TaxID=158877 RepID=UPI001433292A|nr:hypothetical protein [Yokenella regensburgei]QIU92564.1 hypothetical protein HEC60_24910 [Yokenella regensburgei]